MTPPSPLCYGVGIRCLGARFCAESDGRGVILGFLSCGGGFFRFRCVTPPLPPLCGVFWPGFFSELPGYCPGIGGGRRCIQVPFVGWLVVCVRVCDPPSPLYVDFGWVWCGFFLGLF